LFTHGAKEVDALISIQGGGLAGAAGHDDGSHAEVDEALGVLGGRRRVEAAVVGEQRHQGDAHAFEHRCSQG
jgi:hypothetical protein